MFPYEHVPPSETPYCDAKSLHDLLILENISSKANDGTAFDDNPSALSCVGSYPSTNENAKSIEASPNDNGTDSDSGVNGTNLRTLNGIPYLNSPPQQLDPNGDFSYSQKLFHIADGNLYSIFSPLQGRSYGVKPSFLRKQKCTVQECHAKGKKHMRKGLKFHNFLPSESVTSEKDNNIIDKWKVHSECRLREEHGTKQIVISNWSSNLESSGELNEDDSEKLKEQMCTEAESEVPLYASCNMKTNQHSSIFDSKDSFQPSFNDINSAFISDFSATNNVSENSQECLFEQERNISANVKYGNSSLNEMLYSVRNCASKNNAPSSFDMKKDRETNSEGSKKHRRKPVQTRRIVPYVKYLSLIDEIESSPLDLSSKSSKYLNTSDSNSNMETEQDGEKILSNRKTPDENGLETEDVGYSAHGTSNCRISEVPFTKMATELPSGNFSNSKDRKLSINDVPLSYSVPVMHNQFYPMLNVCKTSNALAVSKAPFSTQGSNIVLNKQLSMPASGFVDLNNESLRGFAEINRYQEEKLALKTAQPKTRRRRSQRSVIKQKLEDTFRQNGFLVKTKQVSDGEATFCKFRQLRKYTRYYLKSWQHHLPEEVHKMWKGFLPPKTVLPPILGPSTNNSH